MNDFRFAEPQYGQLLWLLLLLTIVLVWLELRGRSALDGFLSREMQSRLVQSSSLLRRMMALSCFVLGLSALVGATMRPQWGATRRMLPRAGAQVMVCLDVSKSMLAEDTVPNRLERAKTEVADLLDLLKGEQVGLIAFAGKATIVSPMTTDFGFLKLMLSSIGVQSVGMGGTRLEEPIRQAVDGFGEAADISRVILLITDGEDHDSFPLDAAESARERGIKIITIGFGDEAGSKIEITNRRTGARSFVTDSNGTPVISRLDGATLRDIALKTNGAYIPAGTGALDLDSIHRQHIAPLVRGSLPSGEQIVRNEVFQWVVLAGLLLLVLSVMVGRGVSPASKAGNRFVPNNKATAAVAILLVALVFVPQFAVGQRPADIDRSTVEPRLADEQVEPTEGNDVDAESSISQNETDGVEKELDTIDSRDAYNRALPLLASNVDAAESFLQKARRNAGTDGEVRFRAAYNLGWVEVRRADSLLNDEPKRALTHLRSAADWFRQSIRIRPKDDAARHNLEIVMRRTLELADSLAKKDQGDVAQRLDGLIQQQRAFVGEARQLVERLADTKGASPEAELFRRDFRALATQQRQILSDAESLMLSVGEELGALAQKPQQAAKAAKGALGDSGLSDEEQMRSSQLLAVSDYLQRGVQRMGQSRSQLRRKQGQRAFRRAATGLTELKRARDMLRPPQEILKMLIHETRSLIRQTGTMAVANDSVGGPQKSKPSWLTDDYLKQSQLSLYERTKEWTDQMKAALGNSDALGTPDPNASQEQQEQREQEEQRRSLVAATELVDDATQSFTAATSSMESNDFGSAVENQKDAHASLSDALELYLDLKGLIEAAHATENQIHQVLQNVDDLPENRRDAFLGALAQLQQENLDRLDRLEDKLEQERNKIEASAPPQAAGPAAPGSEANDSTEPNLETDRQRIRLAEDLLQKARSEMTELEQKLRDDSGEPNERADEDSVEAAKEEADSETNDDEADSSAAPDSDGETDESPRASSIDSRLGDHAERATDRLQDLRRLFFSVVEHLQETAQRQADVNDQTERLAGQTDSTEQQQTLGPLASKQQELIQLSQQIAEALNSQSEATPPEVPETDKTSPQASAEQQQAAAEQSEQLRKASQLVHEAAKTMEEANDQMLADPFELTELRSSQDESLKRLREALALLVPPQPQDNEPNQDQQQNQDDEQDDKNDKDDGQDDSPQPQSQEQQQDMSMNQLLQMIRDRDAERRREKERQRAYRRVHVEKDW